MTDALPPLPPAAGAAQRLPLRRVLAEASRFWEPRRIVYNLVLAIVTLGWLASTWPHSRAALAPQFALPLAVLVVLANLCYSSAYLVELAVPHVSARQNWPRWRPWLWGFGVGFAALLALYWLVDEVAPSLGGPL
jgi:hypothetical protein